MEVARRGGVGCWAEEVVVMGLRMSDMPSGLIWRTLTVLAFGLLIVFSAEGEESRLNQVGGLKGQVTIVNHPELGRTPAAWMYFVLGRTDCRRCLIGVRTDIDGRYTVFVGAGKYRVYCEDPYGNDLIRKGQTREITVKPGVRDTESDIELTPVRVADLGSIK